MKHLIGAITYSAALSGSFDDKPASHKQQTIVVYQAPYFPPTFERYKPVRVYRTLDDALMSARRSIEFQNYSGLAIVQTAPEVFLIGRVY